MATLINPKEQLVNIIEESLPSRTTGRWHKNIKKIRFNDGRLLRYITKAKTAGKTKAGTYLGSTTNDVRIAS